MEFSDRLPALIRENEVTRHLAARRASGQTIVDLTGSNPTKAALFDDVVARAAIVGALDQEGIARYEPDPRGIPSARRAVAASLSPAPPWERLFLTASTSEAYSLLFKLLCDPGDVVLVPRPSYPLFDYLTALDAVRVVSYELHDVGGGWPLDLAALRVAADAIPPGRLKALLVVNPNNPTGSALDADELQAIAAFCAAHDLALIGDEVFFDYLYEEGGSARRDLCSVGRVDACLTFRLGGLSKLGGLPQLKLGWIAISGPDALVREAASRLEMIADAYLSANMPVQLAAAPLLELAARRRAMIFARVKENRRIVRALVEGAPLVSLCAADGGWSAVLRVPKIDDDEGRLVVEILDRAGVYVYPGFFFDFPRGAHLVISLLPDPQVLRAGLTRVLEVVDAFAP